MTESPMMTTQPISTKGSMSIMEIFKITLSMRMRSHCPYYGVDRAYYQTSEVEFKTLNEFIAVIGGVW